MNGYDTVSKLGCDCGCNGSQKSLGDVLTVNFNSTPDTPETWNCTNWLVWHKKLVQAFKEGRFASGIKYSDKQAIELANQVFMTWWEKQASGFWDSRQFCGYNSEFQTYFKSVGLTDLWSFVAGFITPLAETTTTVATGVKDTATNVVDTASQTSKTLSWLVPTLLVTAVVGVGYYAYKRYGKGDKKLTPYG